MAFPGAVPAGMGKRLLSAVIDAVAGLVLGGGFVVAGSVSMLRGAQDPASAALAGPSPMVLVGFALLLVLGLVQLWFLGSRGFTIGKRLVGVRVLSAQTGRPVGIPRALVRFLVPAAGALVLAVGQAVVYLSPLFDSSGRRQGWHDKAAGTMVFDLAVGLDPSTAPRAPGPDATRRMNALLGGQGVGPSPAPPSGRRAAPAPAPGPTEPPGSSGPSVHAVPSPPSGPSRSLDPSPGIISSVPRGPATGPQPGVDRTAAMYRAAVDPPGQPGAGAESTGPSPAAGDDVVGRPTAPGRRAEPAELAAEVEMTRLRPARGKVPQLEVAAPHATIEMSDGRRVVLERTALIGRQPTPRPGDDEVQLIEVPDPGRSVSKTHLAIGVDRSGVWVRDRDSTNGTVVTLADGQQILCAAEQQVRLPAGASVAFGDYGLTIT